ncbi:MAG: hypothetical protein ACFE89_06750 [Candidatus Hodarchaeota archaeon]
MPSKRSSVIIGIWVIFAVSMIVDFALFQGLFLDSLFPGAIGLLNVLIIAFLPIIGATCLLDRRRDTTTPQEPRRRIPNGARSGSGEPLTRTRAQPRIRRDKRAAQLETIVVEPNQALRTAARTAETSSQTTSSSETELSSARFLRSSRAPSEQSEEIDSDVQEQLDALEMEMAKLEEQLEQNGVTSPSATAEVSAPPEMNLTVSDPEILKNSPLSGEEASSERQAIEELLARLEQRKRGGGVDEATYQRLREKYLKRYSELG